MYKKSDIEMERAKVLKFTRGLVRLKHSWAADVELNEILPERLQQFDAAIQNGELLALPENLEDFLEN